MIKLKDLLHGPITPIIITGSLLVAIFWYGSFISKNKIYDSVSDSDSAVVNNTSAQVLDEQQQKAIRDECNLVFNKLLEGTKLLVDNNQTAIDIVKDKCLMVLSRNSSVIDFDGDGEKEIVLVTSGAGCGSCHSQEIRIINDDKVIFHKEGSDFKVTFPGDSGRFTLEYPIDSLPPCPGDEYLIGNYKARIGENGLVSFDKLSEEKRPYVFE